MVSELQLWRDVCGSLGIDQVINRVSASLETNNYKTVNLGYVHENQI